MDPTNGPAAATVAKAYVAAVQGSHQGKILDPELYEDGRLQKVPGYVTDLLTDRALGFIRRQRNSQRPYFLYLAHKAVHPDAIQHNDGSFDLAYGTHYIAAERHRGRYRNEIFPRTQIAKTAEQGALGSVMVQRFLARKNAESTVREFGDILDPGMAEQSIRDRAEMILSVDEGLGAILSELEESGRLGATAIVLTSDNGFFFGEHGLSVERRLPYEESIRNPLLVRFPRAISAGMRVCAQSAASSKNRASRAHSSMHMPWIGRARSRIRGFFTIRKISMVRTMFTSSATNGTPQRVGGRVAATNSKSALSPSLSSFMARPFRPRRDSSTR